MLATCDADGVPNVSLISQVHYVDPERVALSTSSSTRPARTCSRRAGPSVGVVRSGDPRRVPARPRYEETQTAGPLFESMKAKLAGIASHTGMQGVFRLLGADIFRVVRDRAGAGAAAGAAAASARNLLVGGAADLRGARRLRAISASSSTGRSPASCAISASSTPWS